jgi:hypothetical protein
MLLDSEACDDDVDAYDVSLLEVELVIGLLLMLLIKAEDEWIELDEPVKDCWLEMLLDKIAEMLDEDVADDNDDDDDDDAVDVDDDEDVDDELIEAVSVTDDDRKEPNVVDDEPPVDV